MFFMSILPPGPSGSAVRDFGSFYGIPSLLVLPQRRTLRPSLSPSRVVSSWSPITGAVGKPHPGTGLVSLTTTCLFDPECDCRKLPSSYPEFNRRAFGTITLTLR
jgi:hypothetical protein